MVEGEGDDQLWGSGRGACHCSVLWWREGDDQLWGSGRGAIAGCSRRGAIAGCHFSVPGEGRVAANFGGGAIAGAIIVCYG